MPTPDKLEKKFWKALASDMTVFLGCEGAPPRPMTALYEGEGGPIWFFTSNETELGAALRAGSKDGLMTFASKGHDVWASASGPLTADSDPAVIDRLWNPHVAAWYEGKDDPKLLLVRYDAREAHIWEDGSSLVAGIKMLMGSDPKKDFEDKTAQVRLDD